MTADHRVILDTNVLLDNPQCINEYNNIILPTSVLEEIDKHSHSNDEYKRYIARQARNELLNAKNIKWLLDKPKYILPDSWDITYVDNKILAHCKDENATLITNDINLKIKADAIGVNCERYGQKESDSNYTGYKTIDMKDDELAKWYESFKDNKNNKDNKWDLKLNEYLLIKNNGEIIDTYKWTDSGLKHTSYKTIDTKFSGKIKPRNSKQELAFDMLQDETTHIKCLIGRFGSGKDLLMINTAISLLEKNKYKKIVWIVQNIQVGGTKEVGILKGDLHEKMMPYTSILADKLGGQFGLEMYVKNEHVEIMPLAFIRGRSFENSILMLSEAENISRQHMQLILSRLGENSALFINGDFKQTDSQIFKSNSGLKALIERLQGNSEFGYVMLDKTERSHLAELSDLLD